MRRYSKLLIVFFIILLGKLSGFFKDILITFYHGISSLTDAYFLSNSISSVLYMAVYSSIPIIVVPLYSRLLLSETKDGVARKLSAVVSFFLIVSLCMAFLVLGAASWLVDFFSGEISEQVKKLTVSYISIMAFTFGISTLVSFFNALQTVNKIVMPSYVVPIVNNLVFCFGLYLFSATDDFDKVLMLGVLAWFILLVMNLFVSRKAFSFHMGEVLYCFFDRKFLFLFLPAVFAFYIEQINGFVGVYFASELGVGAISVFAYSNKLNMIFLSVFLVFLTASLFPRIALISSRNDQVELANYLTKCVRYIVIYSVPLIIYIGFYSVDIVKLLFQRGSFIDQDVVKVASVFSVVLLALPFCLIRDIMNRVFFSYDNTLTPVLLSLTALSINFWLSYVFYQHYYLVGLATSMVISTIFNSLVVTFLVQRKIKLDLLVSGFKILLPCGICGVIAYCFLHLLHSVLANYWLILFIPFALIYFLFLLLFKINEVWFLTNLLRGRFL
ncbi:murein biosynthesis integral membrane protein MurJ [Pseudomonas fluvialis]|uniref:murein biosynthesis integral membrane protein MurJ n=1 Tax=Pseudomonas fluvialis TaxID=1793966 RepID=UPI00370A14A5